MSGSPISLVAGCLLVAGLLTPALDLEGQVPSPRPWIEIQEPSEWRGEGTRGLVAQQRRSIRVVGLAHHPAGVTRVLINGERASIERDPAGGTRFVGYVPVTETLREVEVAVYPFQDRPYTQTYRVSPVAAAHAYAPGTDPWADPGVGFRGERWAVVVGVSRYQDPRITPLRFADADALAMYDFLTSERAGLGGFRPENIMLLVNEEATYRNVRTALFDFLKSATRDDIVIIYYAGHGTPDPDRLSDMYLVTYDTDVDRLAGTAFPMDDVASAVRRTLARDILVVTDACHSAGVGGQVGFRDLSLNQINRVFLDQLESSTGGLAILTASELTQLSQEGERWGGGHGIFTYYMLRGLYGEADEDGSGVVTLGELYEYVRRRVSRETRSAQVPTMGQTAFDRSWPMSIVVPGDRPVALAVDPAPAPVPAAPVRVEPEPEPEPAPPPARQEPVAAPVAEAPAPREAPAAAVPDRSATGMSAGQAAALSLVVPGLGQLSTRQPSGAVYLALAGGAVAAGVLVEQVTVRCRIVPADGACPESQVASREVERPLLIPGVGAAAALGVVSAVAAYRGVSRAAALDRRLGQARPETGPSLTWQPPSASLDPEGVRLDLVRIRF